MVEGAESLEAILSSVDVVKPSGSTQKSATQETDKHKQVGSRLPKWWYVGLAVIVALIVGTFWPTIMDSLNNPAVEIHEPGVTDFFPEAMIWEGTHFELNRLTIARFLAAAVMGFIFVSAAARLKMRPSRGQTLIEMGVEFVRQSIGIELLGTSRGKRYGRILAFIFFGVLAMNLTGIIPGINIGASSVVSVPIVFAVFAYIAFIGAGMKARGGLTFFKEQFFPPGVPWPVYILLTPIEAVSVFIVRPATLAIRLLSNMIAGHILLALTYFGTQTLLVATLAMKPIAVATFAASIAITLFEIFVSVLQAYVFTILTAVYIKMSVEAH